MSDERPLGEHMVTPVSDPRLARQWTAIASRLDAPPRPRAWLLFPALVVAAVVAFLVLRPHAQPKEPVAVATASETIALVDGSKVTFPSGSRLTVASATPEKVRIELASGEASFDVTHVEGRSFVVHALGHDVTVVGTQFLVRARESVLTVEVRRGRVRVNGPAGEHILDAGQSWSARVDTSAELAPAPSESSTAIELGTNDAPPVEAPAASARPPAPPRGAGSGLPEDAKELLARATAARAAGKPRDAATALDAIRKNHRSDPRAGLAAFELGRLRLDTLGDPAGAAEAFSDAIVIAPNASFREDAEARRIEALEGAGDLGRCAAARTQYLSHFPNGLHAKQVERRCAGR
jgi:transmembrane sensor